MSESTSSRSGSRVMAVMATDLNFAAVTAVPSSMVVELRGQPGRRRTSSTHVRDEQVESFIFCSPEIRSGRAFLCRPLIKYQNQQRPNLQRSNRRRSV